MAACMAQTAITVAAPAAISPECTQPNLIDFRFSPPEWQTAICLPDDPLKTLVDRGGELLYGYRCPGDREFITRVGVEVEPSATWSKQEMDSPRVPIVRTLRKADGLEIVSEAFAVTDKLPGNDMRADIVLVCVKNTSAQMRTINPQLIVDTLSPFAFDAASRKVVIGSGERITSSLKMLRTVGEVGSSHHIQLEPQDIPAGESVSFFIAHSGNATTSPEITTLNQALDCRAHAVAYWEKAPLPFGCVQVPDPGIQAIFDSSVRNIWQAREIKNGHIAFQVGPTCYRGLWIVDGAFLLESATMLGAGDQARDGVAYELSHQKPDGRIEVMHDKYGYWKENGIVLWTCVRHAMLTQDKAWLEAQWPKLRRVADFIKELRSNERADVALEKGVIPRSPHTTLDAGLMPHGIIDGGLQNGVEYSNTYWNLIGLRALVEAAHWLGKDDQATSLQKEYNDFLSAFQTAAKRDMAKDPHDNNYLPILMGPDGRKELPQRAQWSFCHAVYPGQLFAKEDPLVAGNLAMLKATEKEGMVYGTGWDAAGIWTYFASFYGHAWLWQGDGQKAAAVLYSFGNHASPMLVWREEQTLKGTPFCKVGDMPHNWASAEFIRLTVHLLAIDRGNELHLLEGLPTAWTKSGMVTKLNGIATPFGPLNMELKITPDGKSARLHVDPLADVSCQKIVVHLAGWASVEMNATVKLDPMMAHDETISLLDKPAAY